MHHHVGAFFVMEKAEGPSQLGSRLLLGFTVLKRYKDPLHWSVDVPQYSRLRLFPFDSSIVLKQFLAEI